MENLAIRAGVAAAMARVDLIPAEAAQLDLHGRGREEETEREKRKRNEGRVRKCNGSVRK